MKTNTISATISLIVVQTQYYAATAFFVTHGGGGASILTSSPSYHTAAGSYISNNPSTSAVTPLRTEHKDSDRAHVERNLEDMMGDDWRLFRAKLVTREQQQHQQQLETSQKPSPNTASDDGSIMTKVTGALSSLFSTTPKRRHDITNNDDATAEILHCDNGGFDQLCDIDDPFATAEEIVAVCDNKRTPRVSIVDRHRWAHPISHIERGCVLIANEKLGGYFRRTVVLIVDHNDEGETTGIVINRPLPGNLQSITTETTSIIDPSLKNAFQESPVTFGGPVSPETYCVLHGYGEVDGAKKVAPGVFVGGSQELMHQLRTATNNDNNDNDCFDPDHALFVKGHAAWLKYQLSEEIKKGVWYVVSASPDFILRYAGAVVEEGVDNLDDLWSDILVCMGGRYAELAELGDTRMRP